MRPGRFSVDEARLRPDLRQSTGASSSSPPTGEPLADEAPSQRGRTVVPSPGSSGVRGDRLGVGGVQPGTQPEQALIAKEGRRGRAVTH
jgi:hypothetical protein